MISLKRLFTSFIVLNLLIISFASADTPPEFPFMALSGNVKIDGNNAPLGTIITAFIVDDSDPTTSDGVTTVNENGEYAMLLDDVSEEDVGKEIIFMVDEFIAEQNSIYIPQGEEFLDLTFTIPPFPIDEIITPMDKEFVSTNTPLFEWTETTDPNSDVFYILLISNKEDFSNITIEQEISEPSYELNDEQALEEGTYYARIIATDGFSYIPSEEISFTVDITPPTLETIEINGGKELNNLIYFSPANNDGNYDTIDILLSADEPVMYNRLSIINESGKEVKYFFQTSEFSEDIVKTWEGGFTNTPPPYVPDGKYIIETKIEDRAGNLNTINTAEIVVDNTPPIISNEITRALDGREIIYNSDNVYLNASIVDELSNVSAVLLEGNWWRDSNFANITLTSKGNGNYSYILTNDNLENGEIIDWRYYANDSLGNFAQGNFNTFIVEDREPIFTGIIPDLTFFEDGDEQQIELSKYFSDP
ncbi:MAG: Ig-like domain-containing protein, partial [Nanoarchaeota archaeon]